MYFLFVEHAARRLDEAGRFAPTDAERHRVRTLAAEVAARLRPVGGAALAEAAASGRSVVVAVAHVGVSMLTVPLLREAGLPILTVSAGSQPSAASSGHLSVLRDPVAVGLLRIVKTMRNAPHALWIVPDGGTVDPAVRPLGTRTARIGRGAGVIAGRTGAATFFLRSVFVGDGFELRFEPGPVADGSRDPQDFAEDFHTFYVDRLQEVLDGPPEDLAPRGGLFSKFVAPD